MPVITSKQHVTSLTKSGDSDSQVLSEISITNEIDGRDYTFKIAKSDTHGFCLVNFDELTVCRVDFNMISDIPLLNGGVQINSVFTHKNYRGSGLAPRAYEQLLQNFDVVSDTSQTEEGARHWQVKMSTMENVYVHIVSNFPQSPRFLADGEGNALTYTYGMHDLEESIWGLDIPDVRQAIAGIKHRIDITNEDVVLVAKYATKVQP